MFCLCPIQVNNDEVTKGGKGRKDGPELSH